MQSSFSNRFHFTYMNLVRFRRHIIYNRCRRPKRANTILGLHVVHVFLNYIRGTYGYALYEIVPY
jgi:uncharacterized membrane protein